MHHGQKFVLYSLMGVATTCAFRGVEMTFDSALHTLIMRYTGEVIGLSAGYFLKYRLDKRLCLWKIYENLRLGKIPMC